MIEFKIVIAIDTGVRRPAFLVILHKFLDDFFVKLRRKIEDIVFHAQRIRHMACIFHVVQTATGVTGIGHITVEGQSHEVLLAQLGRLGLSLSAGSACQAGAVTDSYVLAALDVPEARRRGALRFSLGWKNTKEDIAFAVQALQDVIEKG